MMIWVYYLIFFVLFFMSAVYTALTYLAVVGLQPRTRSLGLILWLSLLLGFLWLLCTTPLPGL